MTPSDVTVSLPMTSSDVAVILVAENLKKYTRYQLKFN